ncbi:MAG: hypothetical protein H8E66_05310 [Planctomycetes bacterium]|nr:hypothetical protein [Planctomycetota bacterium]
MSSISGYGYSRGNYSQVVRARNNNRSDRAGQADRDDKAKDNKKNDNSSKQSKTKVFEETFDSSNTRNYLSTSRDTGQFKVESGSAIVLNVRGNGVAYLAANGRTGTELETRDDIKLEAGTYELEVQVAGSFTTRGDDTVEIEIEVNGKDIVDDKHRVKDASSSQVFSGNSEGFTTIKKRFTVTEGSKLEFEISSKDGGSLFVDSAKLTKISSPTGGGSGVDSKQIEALEKRLTGVEQGLSGVKSSVDNNTRATRANGDKIDRLAKEFSSVGDALKGVASKVSGVDAKADANGKKLDDLNTKFGELSDKLSSTLEGGGDKEAIKALTKQTKEVADQVGKALGKSQENGRKVDDLGAKFDSFAGDANKQIEGLGTKIDDAVTTVGKRLDVTDENVNQKFEDVSDKVDQSNRDSAIRDKGLSDKIDNVQSDLTDRLGNTDKKIDNLSDKVDAHSKETNGRIDDLGKKVNTRIDDLEGKVDDRFDKTDQKIDDLGSAVDDRLDKTDQKIDDLGNAVDDRLDKTDQKIDDLESSVNDRFDDVDSKLNDIGDQLGDQVNDVSEDLTTAITELKEVIKEVEVSNDSQLSATVKDLKDDFNKQFNDLKAQHEAESNALLEKLDEVTTALKTLSEQSTEQIAVLNDKLGGLGGQLGAVINKLDLLGQGQGLSHRSLGLFNAAAKVGNGALDKLIGVVGAGNTGNKLRGVQSRLNSVSARFGGGNGGLGSNGLNLLA